MPAPAMQTILAQQAARRAILAQQQQAAIQGPPIPPAGPPMPLTQGPVVPPSFMGPQQGPLPPPGWVSPSTPPPAVPTTAVTDTSSDNTDNTDSTDTPQFDATGATDTFGSWFNKKNSSDALTAFGAAMLKAPTFLQGLGDAALAVNKVDRENRMSTPQEIARANIQVGKTANGGRGFAAKPIASGFAADNTFWQGYFDGTGKQVWTQEGTGATQAYPPAGFVPATQSGMSQRNKDAQKYLTTSRDKADQAQQNFSTYDNILQEAAVANTGSSSWDKLLRGLGTIGGVDMGEDGSLSAQQVLLKNTRKLELNLAQGQKGLGQFTEMERQIVRDALPSMDTEKSTIFRITTQMKLRDQLDTELYNDYMDMPASRRPNFEEYAYDKRREQAKTYAARYKALVDDTLSQYPEYQKYMKGGKAAAANPNALTPDESAFLKSLQ